MNYTPDLNPNLNHNPIRRIMSKIKITIKIRNMKC